MTQPSLPYFLLGRVKSQLGEFSNYAKILLIMENNVATQSCPKKLDFLQSWMYEYPSTVIRDRFEVPTSPIE